MGRSIFSWANLPVFMNFKCDATSERKHVAYQRNKLFLSILMGCAAGSALTPVRTWATTSPGASGGSPDQTPHNGLTTSGYGGSGGVSGGGSGGQGEADDTNYNQIPNPDDGSGSDGGGALGGKGGAAPTVALSERLRVFGNNGGYGGDNVSGVAGGGGGGGAGVIINSSTLPENLSTFTFASSTLIYGGSGGAGGNGLTGGGGGGGGAGLVIDAPITVVVDQGVNILGGNGGGGYSGGGGGGGTGVDLEQGNLELSGAILGGTGGGGLSSSSGAGAGGIGLYTDTDGHTITINKTGAIYSGYPGQSGEDAAKPQQASALVVHSSGNTIINDGAIYDLMNTPLAAQSSGTHVVDIEGDNNTFVNAGSIYEIYPDENLGEQTLSDIYIKGDNNTFEIASYHTEGEVGVQAAGSGNTFAFGTPAASSAFNLAKIGDAGSKAYYNGFDNYEVTEDAAWDFKGKLAGTGRWQVDNGGSMVLTADADISSASAVGLEGGTLDISGIAGDSTTLQTLWGDDKSSVMLGDNTLKLSNAQAGTGDGVFAGTISGAGGVEITGGTEVFSGTNIYTGTTMVDSGATLAAGAANALSASSALTVQANATLALAGYSQSVATLHNAGTVNFGSGSTGGTRLTVNNYSGSGGVLQMSVGTSGSDRLVIDGGKVTGSTTIDLVDRSGLVGATSITGNGIVLVEAINGATTTATTTHDGFTLNGGELSAGAYNYYLASGGFGDGNQENWYLRSSYRDDVMLFSAMPELVHRADMSMLGTYQERQAGAAYQNSDVAPERQSWVRTVARDFSASQPGMLAPSQTGDVHGTQVGTDLFADHSQHLGIYGGYLESGSGVKGDASGIKNTYVGALRGRSRYVGAYWTYIAPHGWYSDTVLQYGWHDTSVDAISDQDSKVNATSWMASWEGGISFPVSAHWAVAPQGQFIIGSSHFSHKTITDTALHAGGEDSYQARLGAQLMGHYTPTFGDIRPYVGLYAWKGWGGATNLGVSYATTRTSLGTEQDYTAGQWVAGLTWQLARQVTGYVEVSRMVSIDHGNASSQNYATNGTVGVQVSW